MAHIRVENDDRRRFIEREREREEQRLTRGNRGPQQGNGPRPGGNQRAAPRTNFPPVDREKTVPFLIRLFLAKDKHTAPSDFRGKLPAEETQIYCWNDSNLREIVDAIKQAHEEARATNTVFSLSSVFTDGRGEIQLRELGKVHSLERGQDDLLTLLGARFSIGDYLDVAMVPENTQRKH